VKAGFEIDAGLVVIIFCGCPDSDDLFVNDGYLVSGGICDDQYPAAGKSPE
jgi:hypothetical protein